jgi:hypothetical protein
MKKMSNKKILNASLQQPRTAGNELYNRHKDVVLYCGQDNFFDILRLNDLLIKRKRNYTHKKLVLEPLNQVRLSDVTNLLIGSKFACLYKYSRKITGNRKALQKAISACSNPESVIQYCDDTYTQLLNKRKMLINMTEENHRHENGLAEYGNGILKNEYILDSCFHNFQQTKQACEQAIMVLVLKLKTSEEGHSGTA